MLSFSQLEPEEIVGLKPDAGFRGEPSVALGRFLMINPPIEALSTLEAAPVCAVWVGGGYGG